MSCVENSVLAPQSFFHLTSCRNLFGLSERRSTFPDELETESGIPRDDPGGGLAGLAEQSPLTGYEPKNLIEICSQHTPINFPSRRNSFNTDFNDVPTIAASEDTDTLGARMTSPLFTQEREVNPFSDSVCHVEKSCGKLQRSGCSDVEKFLLIGQSVLEFGSVSSQEP